MDVSVLQGLPQSLGAYCTWHCTNESDIVLSPRHELLNISFKYIDKEQKKGKYITSAEHRGVYSWHLYGEIRDTAKKGIGSPPALLHHLHSDGRTACI